MWGSPSLMGHCGGPCHAGALGCPCQAGCRAAPCCMAPRLWDGVPGVQRGEVAVLLLLGDVRQRLPQRCRALGHCQQPLAWISSKPARSWGQVGFARKQSWV